MGLRDFVDSTTGVVKRNSPDLTPVKNACVASYTYGWSTVAGIGSTVVVNGLKNLNQQMPDEESRAKIGLFATKLAKNTLFYTLHESYKQMPGANAVTEIVSRTMKDIEVENHKEKKTKAASSVTMMDKPERIPKWDAEMVSKNLLHSEFIGKQNPQDIINIFMMEEFVGSRLFHDLIVPKIAQKKQQQHNK